MTALDRSLGHTAASLNDDFFRAESLGSAPSGAVSGSNVDATAQAGEPSVNSGGRSVWYQWFAPFSGTAVVHATNANFPALLAAFTEPRNGGYGPAGVTHVSTNAAMENRITFLTEAGTAYWIAVDGIGGATGTFTLAWQVTPDGRLPDLVPTLQSASVSYGEVTECEAGHGCGTPGTQRVLLFGTMTINIGASDLYLGGLTNLQYEFHPCHNHTHLVGYASYRLLANGVTQVTGAKSSFCLQDGMRFDTNAWPRQRFRCSFQGISKGWGDYYWPGLPCQWIDITGVPPGRYTLEVEIDPDNQLPESDENNNIATLDVYIPQSPGSHVNEIVETALTLTNARFQIQGPNIAATRDPNEPVVGAGHTVWYRWVAPANGPMSLDVVGSFFPASVGVFTGSPSNLVHVTDIDPFPIPSPAKRVIFQANAGSEYFVAVDSEQANVTGIFKLNGWLGPPPNDDFGNAATWDAVREGVTLSTVNATKEPGEPNHAGNPGGRSIWRRFRPVITRPVIISTGGSEFDTLLAVYTGTSFADLEELASNDNVTPQQRTSQVTLDAEEGEEYWIAVDGRNGEGGRLTLWIDEIDPPTEFLSISVHHGQIELELLGERNRPYRIDASTNLVNWTPMQTIYKTGATALIQFVYDTNSPARFFRAIKQPDND